MDFDQKKFELAFSEALIRLATSEKVTKEDLKILSRSVLEAWHTTGNVSYVNKLLAVLSPMNKKTCVVFFRHFSGFSFDEVQGMFTGKSKKRYEQAHADCVEFLSDPHNNLWTWAERHIEIEKKDFDISAVKKYIAGALKKAQGVGLSQNDILKAVFAGGVEPQAVITVFEEMGIEFAEVETETKE